MRYTGFHRAMAVFHGELRAQWPLCLCNQIETDAIDALRGRYADLGLAPPSYTALVVKAIALGIKEVSREYPEISSMLTGFLGWKTIHAFARISAGVTISRDDAGHDRAVQSVIPDPEARSLAEITALLKRYATLPVKDVPYLRNCHYLYRLPGPLQRAMLWVGRTFPEKRRLYRGTFTLTSVGKFGVDYQLTLPQGSALQFGFGAVRPRPVVRDGQVVAANTFFLTLSFDRRLMNGKPCALLMERIRDTLQMADFPEEPELRDASKKAAGVSSAPAPSPSARGRG